MQIPGVEAVFLAPWRECTLKAEFSAGGVLTRGALKSVIQFVDWRHFFGKLPAIKEREKCRLIRDLLRKTFELQHLRIVDSLNHRNETEKRKSSIELAQIMQNAWSEFGVIQMEEIRSCANLSNVCGCWGGGIDLVEIWKFCTHVCTTF